MRLSGKTAIVTGGYRGLGLSIVKAYLREGARVAVCGRSVENLKALDESLSEYQGKYMWSQCDITVSLEVSNFVKKVIYEFGSVDILVNNAAIFGSNTCLADYDPKLFRNVMEVNLMGSLNISQCVLPHMIEQNYGKFLHVTGSLNMSGKVHGGAYYVSKIALSGFSDILATEYSNTRITSNLINPEGLIEEGNIHFFNNGDDADKVTPEEIQDLFVFLASAESNGINGKTYKACEWVREERAHLSKIVTDKKPSVSIDSSGIISEQNSTHTPLSNRSEIPQLETFESKSAGSQAGYFSTQESSNLSASGNPSKSPNTGTLGAPDSRDRGPIVAINTKPPSDPNPSEEPALHIRPEEESDQRASDGRTLGAPDSRDRGPVIKKEDPK